MLSIRSITFGILVCMLFSMMACKSKVEADETEISVKRNLDCNPGVVCVKVELRLSGNLKNEKTIRQADKELGNCFTLQQDDKELAPFAAEKVNYGSDERLIYIMYFEDAGKVTGKRAVKYTDRFLGLKTRVFNIERN